MPEETNNTNQNNKNERKENLKNFYKGVTDTVINIGKTVLDIGAIAGGFAINPILGIGLLGTKLFNLSNGFLGNIFRGDASGYTSGYYGSLTQSASDYKDGSAVLTADRQALVTGEGINYEMMGAQPLNIFAMPLKFNPLADPFNRVYSKMFLDDLSVIYITPGVPKFNRKLVSSVGDLFSTITGGDAAGMLIPSVTNGNDVRFVSFRADYYQYFKYVSTMLSFCYNMMGVGHEGLTNEFNFDDYYNSNSANTVNKHGLAFFCNKNTTASESISNSYRTSKLANSANEKAGEMREYRQIANMATNGLADFAKGILDLLNGLISSVPIIGSIVAPFAKTLNGSQMYFSDIWDDSSFSRDYSINMRFYSPMGDPESIFRNIIVPLVSVMALALPRQDGIYGYQEPFLVRANCPGWFECECGAITSITIDRGGDDNLWTLKGFPNEVNVTLNIVDLYPQLIQSHMTRGLLYNKGMRSYLECMAGLRIDDLPLGSEREALRKTARSNLKNIITGRNLKNLFSDVAYGVSDTYNNWQGIFGGIGV